VSAPSLARQVALRGVAILATTLLLVGLSTGLLLHVEQRRALDRVLLAAAVGDAHPPPAGRWEAEHPAAPVATWRVRPGDGTVPDAVVDAALTGGRSLLATVGDRRLALVVVEDEAAEDAAHERLEHRQGDHDEDHHGAEPGARLLVAAAAPVVRLADSVGAFSLTYAIVGLLAAIAAAAVLWASVRAAFSPVERAQTQAGRVVSLGQGERLSEEGPAEIRALLVAMNALLDRLDRAYAAQQHFTAEAAHELRTPVTTMLGELDVALRKPRSAAEYRALLQSSREEVERLARLVDGLTALARLDAGQAEALREPVRASELVDAVRSREGGRLAAAGCTLRVQIDDDPELEGHRALLETALGNLLRNVARHAPGASVQLAVRSEGEHAVFEVADEGPGLSEAERAAAFDRFSRGGGARRADREGLGLGLAIARQVARRHGGDCTLHAGAPRGLVARLSIRLPQALDNS